jgi:general secretion pathway protein J
MRRGPATGEDGFTLLELLIALALLGLLMTLIFGGLRLGARAWTAVDHQTVGASDLGAVQDILRRATAGAYPVFASADLADWTVDFDGQTDSLVLVTSLPEAVEADIRARERFSLVQDGQSRSLVMAWRLDLPSPGAGDALLAENRVVLLDHVRSIRFAYFGPPDEHTGPDWQESWSGRTRLPNLVRVQIERDDASLPRWPELVAEPKATATPACLYDPMDGSCRRMR